MSLKPCIIAISLLALSLAAEEVSIPITNLSCQINRYENYDTSDGHVNEIVYWVYAVYAYPDSRTSTYKKFLGGESFLPGSEDHEIVASHCKIVDDLHEDATLNGGFVKVTSETNIYERRSQNMDGGFWLPRPSCRYTIYTFTDTKLTFPGELTLVHSEYTSQTYDDECRA